jgi:hypothetical protein
LDVAEQIKQSQHQEARQPLPHSVLH